MPVQPSRGGSEWLYWGCWLGLLRLFGYILVIALWQVGEAGPAGNRAARWRGGADSPRTRSASRAAAKYGDSHGHKSEGCVSGGRDPDRGPRVAYHHPAEPAVLRHVHHLLL